MEWLLPNVTTNEQILYCTLLCKEGNKLFPEENGLSDQTMNTNKDDNFVLR